MRVSHQTGRLPISFGEIVTMTAPAGRTALFPIGPTAPLTFAAGSPERARVAAALKEVRQADYDVANFIGGREVRTGRRAPIVTPHEHARQLGHVHYGRGGRDRRGDRGRAGRLGVVGPAAVGGARRAVPAGRGHAAARARGGTG